MTQDTVDIFRATVAAAAEALVADGRAANRRFEASVEAALQTCAFDQLTPTEQEAYRAIVVEATMAAARELEVGG